MIQTLTFAGGLNTDDHPSVFPPTDAAAILNMRSSSDSSADGMVDTVKRPTNLGILGDYQDGVVLATVGTGTGLSSMLFVHHAAGDAILEASIVDGVIQSPVRWSGDAGWDYDTIIHTDVAGDYLLWVAEGTAPMMLDMKRAAQGWYVGKPIESMDLAKVQPWRVLSTQLTTTSSAVNTHDRMFQFSYRYVFDTGQVSLLAPFTQAVLSRADDNIILIGLTSDHVMPTDVTSVEYCVRESTEQAMQVFYTDRRTDLRRSDWWVKEIRFTNMEMRYPLTQSESTMITNVTPTSVSSLCVAANRLFLGGYTIGYGITQVPISAAAVYISMPSFGSDGSTKGIPPVDNLLPMGFDHRISIAFFDEKGRSPGVCPSFDAAPTKDMQWQRVGDFITGYDAEVGCNEIEWSINAIADAQYQYIPQWAYSYQIMVSTHPGIIGIIGGTISFMYRSFHRDTITTKKDEAYYLDSGSGDAVAIRILEVLEYSGHYYEFSKGDRVKVWYSPEGARVFDMEVIGYESGVLFVDPFTQQPWPNPEKLPTDLATQTMGQFILYRPSISQDPFYAENGQSFLIDNPGTDNRRFSVVRSSISYHVNGAYTRKIPQSEGPHFIIKDNKVYKRTTVDDLEDVSPRPYITFMPTPFELGETPEYGRQMVIPQDPKEESYPHGIAVSDALVIGSRINGLGTFLPGSRYLLESTSSAIRGLVRLGNEVLAFTPICVVSLAVGQQFLRTSDNNTIAVQSGKVIGQDLEVMGAQGSTDMRRMCIADGAVVYVSDTGRIMLVQQRQAADIGSKAKVSNLVKSRLPRSIAYEPNKRDIVMSMGDDWSAFLHMGMLRIVQVGQDDADAYATIGNHLVAFSGMQALDMTAREGGAYDTHSVTMISAMGPGVPKMYTGVTILGHVPDTVRVAVPAGPGTTVIASDFRKLEGNRSSALVRRDDADGDRYSGKSITGRYAHVKVSTSLPFEAIMVNFLIQKGYDNSSNGGGGSVQDSTGGDTGA